MYVTTYLPSGFDPVDYDLFVVAGQSNAVGKGEGPAVTVPSGDGYELLTPGIFTEMADPVGYTTTLGTAWPSWANSWKSATGRTSLWAGNAIESSSLVEEADTQHWEVGSATSLYPALVSNVNSHIAVLNKNPNVGRVNVYVIWVQGETDAFKIEDGTITAAAHKVELQTLVNSLRSDIGMKHMFISSVGRKNSGFASAESAEIRAVQHEIADENGDVTVVFDRAQYFPDESKMLDNDHYNQVGLNELGTTGAINAAAAI
jgi:hypothetical protein